MSHLEQSLLELIRRAACELTQDVLALLERTRKGEDPESNARFALDLVRESVAAAAELSIPLAPDPLFAHFFVSAPPAYDFVAFRSAAESAVADAAKKGYISTDFVDPAGGRPVRAGTGPGHPAFHFVPELRDDVEVRLILDGSIEPGPRGHYILPNDAIGAARNLAGVRRAALDALVKEQGSGSGPGVLAVGIGGDAATSGALAHEQLLRPLNDRSRTKHLADLESRILEDANTLGIGPMGFGGKCALLAVKVAAQLACASTFHVSVCYQGWALRRQGFALAADGSIRQWLFDGGNVTPFVAPDPPPRSSGGKHGALSTGATRRATRQLLAGDDDAGDSDSDAESVETPKKRRASAKGSSKATGSKTESTVAGSAAPATPEPAAAKSEPKSKPKAKAKKVVKADAKASVSEGAKEKPIQKAATPKSVPRAKTPKASKRGKK